MPGKKSSKNIVVFLSSVRLDRMADRVLKVVKEEIEMCGNKAIIFDPLNMNFKMLETPLHFFSKLQEAPAWLKEANIQLEMADAFLIITAEYNSSLPPALVNMLDHFPPASYRHRPCAIVSYSVGELGGIRSQTLLHILTIELGMLNLPRNVHISKVQEVLSDTGECQNYKICAEIAHLLHELDWFAEAILNKKKITSVPS